MTYAAAVAIAVVAFMLGAAAGAAWARTKRGWRDWQYTRSQVSVMRRIFFAAFGKLVEAAAVPVSVVVVLVAILWIKRSS